MHPSLANATTHATIRYSICQTTIEYQTGGCMRALNLRDGPYPTLEISRTIGLAN